jgi:DNA polymerase (family 10)
VLADRLLDAASAAELLLQARTAKELRQAAQAMMAVPSTRWADAAVVRRAVTPAVRKAVDDLDQRLRSATLDALERQVPRSVVSLHRRGELTRDTLRTLWLKGGLVDLESIDWALSHSWPGPLRSLPAQQGEAVAQLLAQSVAASPCETLWHDAAVVAGAVKQSVGDIADHLEPAGSLRRREEQFMRVSLVARSADPTAVLQAAACAPCITRVESVSAHLLKCRAETTRGGEVSVHVRVFPPRGFFCGLNLHTGSHSHRDQLKQAFADHQIQLTDWGPLQGMEALRVDSEEELYSMLGVAYVPPELREGTDELMLAQPPDGFASLIDAGQIRTQCWARVPARATLSEVQELVADQAGPSCLLFHGSGSQAVTADELAAVKRWLGRSSSRVLLGLDVDVDGTGALAAEAELLDRVDLVRGAIRGPPPDAARAMRAFDDPRLDVWARPTGRLLPDRSELEADWEQLFSMAARRGVALEVDGTPEHMDPPADLIRQAVECGCGLLLAGAGPTEREAALMLARRGRAPALRVLNALEPARLRASLEQRGHLSRR